MNCIENFVPLIFLNNGNDIFIKDDKILFISDDLRKFIEKFGKKKYFEEIYITNEEILNLKNKIMTFCPDYKYINEKGGLGYYFVEKSYDEAFQKIVYFCKELNILHKICLKEIHDMNGVKKVLVSKEFNFRKAPNWMKLNFEEKEF
ncbi:MAG: hypothetical protein WCR30_01295 [Clostridia bacterium]